MKPDGPINLVALQEKASTSRFLNLTTVKSDADEEVQNFPFFKDRTLNVACILKQRLAPHEAALLPPNRTMGTKVVVPFQASNLRAGGRAIFVGERNWSGALLDLSRDPDHFVRDMDVLAALDELPTLDPFLMRENLQRRGHTIARAYFKISPNDLLSMRSFVSTQIEQLIAQAFPGGSDESCSRLAAMLLSSEVDERLEPLRLTLRLEGDQYREGVFCWKGFLYYKWQLTNLLPVIERMRKEIPGVRVVAPTSPSAKAYMAGARHVLPDTLQNALQQIKASLSAYDHAFRQLVGENPTAFRDFLLDAPRLFQVLGAQIGSVAHVAALWSKRFPPGFPSAISGDEALAMFEEFENSLIDFAADAPTLKKAAFG